MICEECNEITEFYSLSNKCKLVCLPCKKKESDIIIAKLKSLQLKAKRKKRKILHKNIFKKIF